MDLAKISTLGMALVGAAFMIVSPLLLLRTRRFRQSATKAEGVVTDVVKTDFSSWNSFGSRVLYCPRFSFKTAAGEPQSVLSRTGTNPAVFKVGDNVKVLYEPASPGAARIDSTGQLWLVPIVVGVVGLFVLGLGCFLYSKLPS